MGVLEFLRDVGKHVTVNTMLAKESVKARVESDAGISFTEFSYMLLQANDYRHLHDTMGVELQVGGSDQWGNITAGIDLIRRTSGGHVHGLTVPLVTRADGQKFGKSVDGVGVALRRAHHALRLLPVLRERRRPRRRALPAPVDAAAGGRGGRGHGPPRRGTRAAGRPAGAGPGGHRPGARRRRGRAGRRGQPGLHPHRRRARGGGVGRAGRQPAQRAPGARRPRPAPRSTSWWSTAA